MLLPLGLFFLLLTGSCRNLASVTDHTIPRLPEQLAEADFQGLLDRLKPFADMSALRASRVLLQFLDAQSAERFRQADAILIVQRPDKIRLRIQVPVTGSRIADMVSEAKRFKVAIYTPQEYRRFLLGTSDVDYSAMRARLGKEEQQSTLLNARPFHFTNALLISPLHQGEAGFTYVLEEALLKESDTRPGAKKGAQVLHSFYVITEIELNAAPGSQARTRRRFWFDRAVQAQFVRQQLFDERGQVVTEIEYSNYLKLSPDSDGLWPGVILISRPRDGYAARLTFTTGSFEVNPDLSTATPFVLENTEGLPETDLDKQP